MKKKKTIIIFLYADIKEYPPSINAANILAENGWNVTVLSMFERDSDILLNKNIKIKYIGKLKPGIKNIINYLKSGFLLFYNTIKIKPVWILSYDGMSVFPSFIASKLTKTKWAFHQHDFWQNPKGWLRFPYWCEQKLTKYANLISFPQPDRAKLFKEKNNITKDIKIVFNGPGINWTQNSSPNELIRKIKKKNGNILIYQGGWAKRFSVQNVINALSFLTNTYFIILGKPLESGILTFYKEFAKKHNVLNNVFFIKQIPYFDLPNYTNFCNIGVANFTYKEKETINNLLLAGASNKIIEYCACSLPILAPDTPVNREFIDKKGRGLVCNPEDPEDIAMKITALLEKKEQFSTNNLKEFNTFLNFDSQFDKILKILNQNV